MYPIKYQLQAPPTASDDGSSAVRHQIRAYYQKGDDWIPIPRREKGIPVSAFDLNIVLAMPDATPGQKQDKVDAYKQLIYRARDADLPGQDGWSLDYLQSILDANDHAATAAETADKFLTVTLGQSYPVGFSLQAL